MNYQEWRIRRDQLLATHDVLRLDCMNPFLALSHLRSSSEEVEESPRDVRAVVRAWSRCVGRELAGQEWIVTRGVRSLLQLWCSTSRAQRSMLFLPEDVFPTYWAIAKDGGIKTTPFPTLPSLDLSVLHSAGAEACVVLPIPLSPLGRELNEREITDLLTWLSQSPRRTLVLDLVYAYRGGAHRGAEQLRATGQCIEAWSLSKTWLARQIFGVAILPESWKGEFALKTDSPTAHQLNQAFACFEEKPRLPKLLQERFSSQWDALSPAIRKAYPGWTAPPSGYFSILPIPSSRLLQDHGILAVPASVFGAKADGLSVITCLYDIQRDDGIQR